MKYVNSFLIFSAVAYFLGVLLPYPATLNIRPVWVEKLAMLFYGLVIIVVLAFIDKIVNPTVKKLIPFLLGVVWSVSAGLSYLGYVEWNIIYHVGASDIHQVAMWFWDCLIALCWFRKV